MTDWTRILNAEANDAAQATRDRLAFEANEARNAGGEYPEEKPHPSEYIEDDEPCR